MIIKNLNKSYGSKQVLKNINFEIPVGKITSFIGPNGAGKSTVLNILTRLIKRDSGDVLYNNRDILSYKNSDLSKEIAILTQKNNIKMKLTIRELVTFGRFPYSGGRTTQEDKEIVDQALDYMELTALESRFIDEVSGGQLQRAYIAMVIAQDTKYVFLDEPTNNLDIYHASKTMKMARNLCDHLGKTVVMVLHEINYAAFYSDYICAFKDGQIFKFGSVEEVVNNDILSKLYNVDFEIIQVKDKPLSVYY